MVVTPYKTLAVSAEGDLGGTKSGLGRVTANPTGIEYTAQLARCALGDLAATDSPADLVIDNAVFYLDTSCWSRSMRKVCSTPPSVQVY
jgi:hypothetical protein